MLTTQAFDKSHERWCRHY